MNDARPTRADINWMRRQLWLAHHVGMSDEDLRHMTYGFDPKAAVDFSRMLATIAKETPKVDPDRLDAKERRLLKGRIRRARKALIEYRGWLTDE